MLKGIDVSVNNGNIDWRKVKSDNVDFAMIKATQGHSLDGKHHYFTESKFTTNIISAGKAEIQCGVYHYLTAKTVAESIKEADTFIKAITPYKKLINLWAAVDVEEEKYLPKDKKLLTAIVEAFCGYVKTAGYKPMVYTNPNYLKSRLHDISKWDLWLALWRDKGNIPSIEDYPNLKIWQWGADNINGIMGKCDCNIGIDIPELNIVIDYASLVCKKCGLEDQTREYIDKYPYAEALWRKLYEQIK